MKKFSFVKSLFLLSTLIFISGLPNEQAMADTDFTAGCPFITKSALVDDITNSLLDQISAMKDKMKQASASCGQALDLSGSLAMAVRKIQSTRFTAPQTLNRTYDNTNLTCTEIGPFFSQGETTAVEAFSNMLNSGSDPITPSMITPMGFDQAYPEFSVCFTSKGVSGYDTTLAQVLAANGQISSGTSQAASSSPGSSINDVKTKFFSDFQNCIATQLNISVGQANSQCAAAGAFADLAIKEQNDTSNLSAMGGLLASGITNINSLAMQLMQSQNSTSSCPDKGVGQLIGNTISVAATTIGNMYAGPLGSLAITAGAEALTTLVQNMAPPARGFRRLVSFFHSRDDIQSYVNLSCAYYQLNTRYCAYRHPTVTVTNPVPENYSGLVQFVRELSTVKNDFRIVGGVDPLTTDSGTNVSAAFSVLWNIFNHASVLPRTPVKLIGDTDASYQAKLKAARITVKELFTDPDKGKIEMPTVPDPSNYLTVRAIMYLGPLQDKLIGYANSSLAKPDDIVTALTSLFAMLSKSKDDFAQLTYKDKQDTMKIVRDYPIMDYVVGYMNSLVTDANLLDVVKANIQDVIASIQSQQTDILAKVNVQPNEAFGQTERAFPVNPFFLDIEFTYLSS